QVSQWRTNSCSYSTPLRFEPFLAASRSLVQARVSQSVNTSRLSARRLPSGLRAKLPTSSGRSVTCPASPPPAGMRQTCELPEADDSTYSALPSAAQAGLLTDVPSALRRFGWPPASGTA